jgi:hypothetical protein
MKTSIALAALSVIVLAPTAGAAPREHGRHPQLRQWTRELTAATSQAYRKAVELGTHQSRFRLWRSSRHNGRQRARAVEALRELNRAAADFRSTIHARLRDPQLARVAWRDLARAHRHALDAVEELPGGRNLRRDLRQITTLVEQIRQARSGRAVRALCGTRRQPTRMKQSRTVYLVDRVTESCPHCQGER